MAIIQYTLVNGTAPNYITDGGYFKNPSDNTLIGIGSGGGTTLSKADLITRVLSVHGSRPRTNITYDGAHVSNKTNAEVTTEVNAWCTLKGVS
mgnify:FL=1